MYIYSCAIIGILTPDLWAIEQYRMDQSFRQGRTTMIKRPKYLEYTCNTIVSFTNKVTKCVGKDVKRGQKYIQIAHVNYLDQFSPII